MKVNLVDVVALCNAAEQVAALQLTNDARIADQLRNQLIALLLAEIGQTLRQLHVN